MEAVLPCIRSLQIFAWISNSDSVWSMASNFSSHPSWLPDKYAPHTSTGMRGGRAHKPDEYIYFKQLFKTDQKGRLPNNVHTTQR